MKKIIFIIFLIPFMGISIWAQKPKDTLNTEIIEVVKPYVPTIFDSFKINEQPTITEEVIEKNSILYQINSVPVASTFTPNKGKSIGVTKPVRDKLFENYISFGFGNYTSPLFEAYMKTYPTRDSELGFIANHHSSKGGIKEIKLNNAYSDTNANVYYKQEDKEKIWKLDLGITHGLYNWYGLSLNQVLTDDYLKNINPKHTFLGIVIQGELVLTESFLKDVQMEMSTFSDSFNSSEQRFRIQPTLELPISTERINFKFDIDNLSGKFNKNYGDIIPIKYNYLNAGVVPNFEVLRENLTINLGTKLYYFIDNVKSEGKFKAYPNVDISYQLIEEVLTVFAGATGGISHNTYRELAAQNPFLSPNFISVPTDEKYKIYMGFKGKAATNMGYLLSASYSDVKNKAMYVLNPSKTNGSTLVEKPYELGNSFNVIYDDATIINLVGELSLDFSKEFTFGGNVHFDMYNFKNEVENWNLPSMKTTVFAEYHDKKWTGNAKLFMMSERKDREIPYGIMTFAPEDYLVSSGTYLDLNASLSYKFTDRLSAFAKANNLLTTQYKRYYNYPVLGIQVLAGISYKFDL